MWKYLILVILISVIGLSVFIKNKHTQTLPSVVVQPTPVPTQKAYEIIFPDEVKVNTIGNGPDWYVETKKYFLIVKEFAKEEDSQHILGLVPQNALSTKHIGTIEINGKNITKAEYETVDLEQFYKFGGEMSKTKKWTSYGYIIQLPQRQLFIYFSSQILNDKWMEKNILGKIIFL